MTWKAFIIAFISITIISFPQNIIGCADSGPDEFSTSFFFHNNLPDAQGYRPFYYTDYSFTYDDNEPADVSDLLAKEWASYCGMHVNDTDAKAFVNKYALKDLNSLYYNIEKKQPLQIPDSVQQNSMTNYFLKTKDLEALGYIMYAKQLEPFVITGANDWETPERDSVKMDRFIKKGEQLYNASKKAIFKLKYAYQIERLAHYNSHYSDAIKYYDEYVANNNTQSVIQPLCMSLKAGALYKLGNKKEAAYLFSKAFSASLAKRRSNYISFGWSIGNRSDSTDMTESLKLCKNDEEKANMLVLYALGGFGNELATMQQVYKLSPNCDALEVLAVREINKLEGSYFGQKLSKNDGTNTFSYRWDYRDNKDSSFIENEKEAKALANFLNEVAQNKNAKNRGLFETGAAYTAYMTEDYPGAKKYLAVAEKMNLTQKAKDQCMLTNLLVTINEKDTIDAAFEDQLLASIQWLQSKSALSSGVVNNHPDDVSDQWKAFYINLMREILAPQYKKQGDFCKELLILGTADWMNSTQYGAYYGYYTQSVEKLHETFSSKEVEELFALMDKNNPNKFETYLFKHNAIQKVIVTDYAGTAYLRDNDYVNAIKWLGKQADQKSSIINTNPFIELLYDQEEALPYEAKFSTTQLDFAQEMLRLQNEIKTNKKIAAKDYYKMAVGFYNITYYGHAWQLVQYNRSGSDGYYIPKDATPFKKEYYGCFKAHDYFAKAMNASSDKNFKAKCLFMMAKCAQKQVQPPIDSTYGFSYPQLYDADYISAFTKNKYFPSFIKEYGNTPFYKEAYNSCSYLRDFVKQH